jgi:hypothetical protein
LWCEPPCKSGRSLRGGGDATVTLDKLRETDHVGSVTGLHDN